MILLCDGYITAKMNKMQTYPFLVQCYYEPDCVGDSQTEEFGCCEEGQDYASGQDLSAPCFNW